MTKKTAQLDAEIAEALAAPKRYLDPRFVKADTLVVGDTLLMGSVPPHTAHEIVQIEPAPRRKLRFHLVRLPDREHAWTITLRPTAFVGVP